MVFPYLNLFTKNRIIGVAFIISNFVFILFFFIGCCVQLFKDTKSPFIEEQQQQQQQMDELEYNDSIH